MQPSKEKLLEMLRTMLLTRCFEDKLMELCQIPGKVPGMMILCTGQEAVASGVCAALEQDDVIIPNHRSHGHLLAKGADPGEVMAECFGKITGCNKGKSGTLHIAVPEVNALCTTTRGWRRNTHCGWNRVCPEIYEPEEYYGLFFRRRRCGRGFLS